MGHHKVIMFFGVLSFLGWIGSVGTTKNAIKEVGFHKRYYPSRYVMPNRNLRKLFNLKKQEIPKWVRRELLMSFVYIGLFIVFTLMYLISENKLFISEIFFKIYGVVMFSNLVHTMIFLFIFRQRK